MSNLLGFDLETTGVSVMTDKPVQACLVWRQGGTDRVLMNTRVNPCMAIDPAATAIHGITQDQVRYAPDYSMVAWQLSLLVAEIAQQEAHSYLVTFNGNRFDIPLLNVCLGQKAFNVLDIDVLRFARHYFPDVRGTKGGKTLGELYHIFVGRPLEGAHDAAADVIATLDLLDAMQIRAQIDLDHLAEEQKQARPYRVMPIGKYTGVPVEEVPVSWAQFMATKSDLDPDLQATVDTILGRYR